MSHFPTVHPAEATTIIQEFPTMRLVNLLLFAMLAFSLNFVDLASAKAQLRKDKSPTDEIMSSSRRLEPLKQNVESTDPSDTKIHVGVSNPEVRKLRSSSSVTPSQHSSVKEEEEEERSGNALMSKLTAYLQKKMPSLSGSRFECTWQWLHSQYQAR